MTWSAPSVEETWGVEDKDVQRSGLEVSQQPLCNKSQDHPSEEAETASSGREAGKAELCNEPSDVTVSQALTHSDVGSGVQAGVPEESLGTADAGKTGCLLGCLSSSLGRGL